MKSQNIVSNDHNSYLTITLNYKLIVNIWIHFFFFPPENPSAPAGKNPESMAVPQHR